MKYMEIIRVFNGAPVASLLSSGGITATEHAIIKAINNIKVEAKAKGVYITYWSSGKVTFTCIYSHTIPVPAKALKSLANFETWNIERIARYHADDMQKAFQKPIKF